MPDHSSDETRAGTPADVERPGAVDTGGGAVVTTRAQRRTAIAQSAEPAAPLERRTDWRLGGRTVVAWREWLLGGALVSLGLGVLAGTLVTRLWASASGAAVGTTILWLGMLIPVVWALSRSRPAGLLHFRPVDVLYGVGLGIILRLVQGWLEVATGGSGALPSYPLVDGELPTGWWFTDALAVVGIAPLVEEFFFRGVILVGVYTVVRRPLGAVAAGVAAVLVSAGLFVLVHGLAGGLSTDQTISLLLLGLVCGLVVMLTGRIWGAVLVHIVYNLTFIVISLAGTYFLSAAEYQQIAIDLSP